MNECALSFPFIRDAGGRFTMSNDWELLEMDIIQAVQTVKGSRPMWKELGCNIAKVLFINEPSESMPASVDPRNILAKEYVTEAVEAMVPNAIIYDVTAENSNDKRALVLTITYGMVGYDMRRKAAVLYPISAGDITNEA